MPRVDPEELPEGMDPPHLMFVRNEVRAMVDELDLDESLVMLSEQFYTQAQNADADIISLARFAAGCLMAAAKMQDIPVSDQEIAEASHSSLGNVTTAYQNIGDLLGLQIGPIDPVPFIKQTATEAGLSEDALQWALDTDKAVRDDVLGRGIAPTSYAAALAYCASQVLNEGITQSTISKTADVSEVTIRNNYPDIFNAIND